MHYFKLFDMKIDFLNEDPEVWYYINEYKDAKEKTQNLKVVYYRAEKALNDYNSEITTNKD